MNEKTVYACADQEHDAWVCGKCGYIENFEADGPEENGWRFCPACGREIVIADETSELTKKTMGLDHGTVQPCRVDKEAGR
jgi:ribosomal protein S27AE